MKDVLIGSVFANDLGTQPKWLDLQLRFIRNTTKSYDHVAVVSEGLTSESFNQTHVIIPENTSLKMGDAHLQGLNTLLSHFKQQANNYSYFLFLDGDAFPIRKNWLNDLKTILDPQSAMALPKTTNKEIAAIVRSENLERRLHSSVLLVKSSALQNLDFVFGTAPQPDILGRPESDIYLWSYEAEYRNLAFPLIRSNQWNVDPIACGIYYDMFYHHCCGSDRPFATRSDNYWKQIIPERNFTERLMTNPIEFINKLAGWNPKMYLNQNDD